jgi:hypothetical protein
MERKLYIGGEVALIIDIAGRTVDAVGQGFKVGQGALTAPAARADEIPAHAKEADTRRFQAKFDHFTRLCALLCGQYQRAYVIHSGIGSGGDELG